MGAEVALAVILVSGAGLVGRSLLRLSGVDPGFGICRAGAVMAPAAYRCRVTDADAGGGHPGLRSACWPSCGLVPARLRPRSPARCPSGPTIPMGAPRSKEPRRPTAGRPTVADFRIVSPDYFRTVEIPVRKGREFQESDVAGAPYVAIVNEAFVRKYLGAGDPLGQRVRFPGMDSGEDPWATIVGVVGDNRAGCAHESAGARDLLQLSPASRLGASAGGALHSAHRGRCWPT